MNEQKFPPGWDEKRVRDLISFYDQQSEDDQFDEIEAAIQCEETTMMAVPTELVPEVQALIARTKQSA